MDYKHTTRALLAELDNNAKLKNSLGCDIYKFILPMSTSGFDYYNRYKDKINQDLSLNTVTSLCNFPELMQDVEANDKTVDYLAHFFNNMISSGRSLFKCYDCGTSARAMFLHLIAAHRNKPNVKPPPLTKNEWRRLRTMYVGGLNAPLRVREFAKFITSTQRDTCCICSISLGKSGHVWVIEKIHLAGSGKARYRLYQSSFYSHLVIDWIEHKDYASNISRGIDMDEFNGDLLKMVNMPEGKPWTESTKHLFSKLFAFLPNNPVIDPKYDFLWAYVHY